MKIQSGADPVVSDAKKNDFLSTIEIHSKRENGMIVVRPRWKTKKLQEGIREYYIWQCCKRVK